jgi:hypothetical protein
MWHGAKPAGRLPAGVDLKFASTATGGIVFATIAVVVLVGVLILRRLLE